MRTMARLSWCLAVCATTWACGDDSSTGGSGGGGSPSDGGGGSGAGEAGGSGGDGGSGAAGGEGGGAQTENVEISFTAKIDGADFACGTVYDGLGTANSSGQLTDFRLYVHDVALVSGNETVPVTLDQDGAWQYQNVALLDFEDKTGACANGTTEVNVTVRGTVPAGTTFEGVRFKLGVPFDLNHAAASTAPSPLNLTALFWNWQGGYKFLRADFVAEGADGPFNLHLGSTGCDGDPNTGGTTSCMRPNVTEVTLPIFDPATDVVVVDYGAVVAGATLGGPDAGGAPGCMSGVMDPECVSVFANLGIDVATGDLDPSQQTLFSVE